MPPTKLLLLEPDPLQALALAELLLNAGHGVSLATSREALIRLASSLRYDAALISMEPAETSTTRSLAQRLVLDYGLPSVMLCTSVGELQQGTAREPADLPRLHKPYTGPQCRQAVERALTGGWRKLRYVR